MKMAKKVLAVLLSVLFVVGVFTACSSNGGDTKKKEDTTNSATSKLKVGFIFLHDKNSTYDLNFIKAADAACEKLGITGAQKLYKTQIPEGQEAYDAAVDLAEQGCNIIFADSFGHEPYIIEAAKKYPNVQFCHSTGTRAHTEGLANYHNAFASIYEGRYLAGIAAGMKLNEMIEAGKFTAEEAKIGYVGAFTYAEVVSGYTSFFLGARSVCPTVTMEVTFTGSWYDETLEKTGAELLIDRGCKLISQHADSYGAPTACQNAGVPNVSYNGSTKNVGADTYIISSRIDWAPYYEYAIKAVMDGTEIATDWTGTLATGSVVLEELNTDVAAAGTAEAIAAATTKLENGELHVFDVSTFTTRADDTMNTFKVDFLKVDADGHITSYLADVDTDEAYTGDTEVVHDGYFSESEKRSAPYFDLQIDGIELLNTAM